MAVSPARIGDSALKRVNEASSAAQTRRRNESTDSAKRVCRVLSS